MNKFERSFYLLNVEPLLLIGHVQKIAARSYKILLKKQTHYKALRRACVYYLIDDDEKKG